MRIDRVEKLRHTVGHLAQHRQVAGDHRQRRRPAPRPPACRSLRQTTGTARPAHGAARRASASRCTGAAPSRGPAAQRLRCSRSSTFSASQPRWPITTRCGAASPYSAIMRCQACSSIRWFLRGSIVPSTTKYGLSEASGRSPTAPRSESPAPAARPPSAARGSRCSAAKASQFVERRRRIGDQAGAEPQHVASAAARARCASPGRQNSG